MKLDTLGVQAFVAIADHGGFQKAAAALHLTQTALTRRLQNLEAFLGLKLVERTTRSLALTQTGQAFLPQARRLLADLSNALTEIRETGKAQRGDVSIACVPTVGVQYLPRIIEEYAKRHPANRIKILDHASARVAEAVLRREAEFGIHIAGTGHPELHSVPLLTDRYAVICRDDHPLAERKRVTWKQLNDHVLIFTGEGSSNRPVLNHALSGAALALKAHYEVQRSSTAVGLVAAGVGIAVVPRLAMQRGAYPNIKIIALSAPVVSRKLALVSRRMAHLSPAAQALYDMIVRSAATT